MKAAWIGVLVGALNGVVCHAPLVWARDKRDKVFYGVWLGGLFYKLAFFGLAFWWLSDKPDALVPGMLGLVAGQLAVGVIPLKGKRIKHGIRP